MAARRRARSTSIRCTSRGPAGRRRTASESERRSTQSPRATRTRCGGEATTVAGAGPPPGASFLDVEEDLSSPPGPRGRHPLPEPERFRAAAGRAGIGDGVFVVAYGSMGGAPRLWWLLPHFGPDDCA